MPARLRPVGPAGAILLIGGSGALLAAGASTKPLGLAGVAAVAAGLGLLAVQWIRRRREVRALETVARALLAWTPAGEDPERIIRPLRGGGWAGDLAPLRAALADLGHLLTGRIKELAKHSRNLESLIDALDEPVLATGEQDRVILCNRSAEALLGSRGTLVGRPVGAVLTQEDLLEMHGAARRGETRRGRVRVTTSLGARVFQVSAAPIPAAWGGGVFGAVVVLRDVTELDRADRVRADFVANASHELRTPVAAIRGAIETLQGGARDDPEARDRLLAMALRHADRLEEMTRDLLDLSRLESPEAPVVIAPIDWGALESSLRSLFEEGCRARRLVLEFAIDPALREPEPARSDASLVGLILRNLIENAVKFAYEGTTIEVTARRVDGPGGGVMRLRVRDRGIGVPLHLRDRVFERYFQVDPARAASAEGGRMARGTGLGLAIVKHAAKVLGGEVGLDSVYGEWTEVHADLPLGAPARAVDGGTDAVSRRAAERPRP
jgi:two-component system phosphate regulon sensor histidine kinase PhoR